MRRAANRLREGRRATDRGGARFLRWSLVAALAAGTALIAAASARALPPRLWLDLTARGGAADSPASWLDGGTGRLELGEEGGDEWTAAALGEAALGLDWQASDGLAAHLHARARAVAAPGGDPVGLVEAWLEGTRELRGGADRLRLRGGQLFLPTSRENVGPLWSSPYTFTLSAINSWIGEEIRPLGLFAEYELGAGSTQAWRAGTTAFLGNDAAGALLAWRGWAVGDRLSTLGETLPLPALPSLAADGVFAGQADAGTRPIGADLDGRPGVAGWLRWRGEATAVPVSALLQLTYLDSRGDLELHDGEYAWATDFLLLAGELRAGDRWTLAGEHLAGSTAMGVPSPRADVELRASYLLLSWERTPLRASVRWDHFSTRDRDAFPGTERNDEDGEAWTAALLWQLRERLFVGVELLELDAERALAAAPSGSRAEGGRAVTVGLRYRLGPAP